MAKNTGGFFWGVLLGAVATAIAGCVVMSGSCKTFPAGASPVKSQPKRAPKRKAGTVRRIAVKK
jgi:hypothetical protein